MIRLEQILTPGRSLVNVPGGSKKRVLEQIANLVARELPGFDSQDIFDSLVARERLGSTGFGNGIAIPHCRLPGCQSPISAIPAPWQPYQGFSDYAAAVKWTWDTANDLAKQYPN